MADSSLDRAYTAGLTIVRVPTAKVVPVKRMPKSEVKRWLVQSLTILVYSGMIFGALVLPVILHDWILIETGRSDIADAISAIVFGAFTLSLGIGSGVYHYLRGIPRVQPEETPARHGAARRAIRIAKV